MNDDKKTLIIERLVQNLIDQGRIPEESREYAKERMRIELDRVVANHCRRVGRNIGLMLAGVSSGLLNNPTPMASLTPLNN